MRSEVKILVIMAAFGLLLITAEATAIVEPGGPITDTFWVEVDADGAAIGGGSGYDADGDGEGEWYHYPNTGWWNEWFYDHPFDPERWKKIDISFNIVPLDPALDSYAEVTYNWSTPLYPANPDQPPLPEGLTPELEADWIVRDEPYIFEGEVPVDGACVTDSIDILEYNPEWISVDIQGYNFEITCGCITHECIPEPATMSLLVLGGIGMLVRRRRK